MAAHQLTASKNRLPVIAVLLAACAGAVNAFAFSGLGNAFAGIITGNLVTAGYGVASGDAALIRPTATAVAGCIVGELAWARLLRRPGTALPALLAELALLMFVLIAWLAAGSHPGAALKLVMLALVSVALGGQSIWALRVHQTTTYFTGMLTTAISKAEAGSGAGLGVSVRQLGALVAGAIASAAVLRELRPAAPVIPLLLLAAAVAVQAFWRRDA
jgi:uncharacterized membrane protein YoaK (UPF0700 family)